SILEQKMGLIEEENELGLLRIAHFGEPFEQLGQKPEQEGRVQLRRFQQLVGGEDVDHAAAIGRCPQEIHQVEGRFGKEIPAALFVESQQAALDSADAGRGDVAVRGLVLGGVVTHELQHRAQVFEVQEQEAIVVGNLERGREHAGLRIVEIEQVCQEERSHLVNRGPDRIALIADDVPENYRRKRVLPSG